MAENDTNPQVINRTFFKGFKITPPICFSNYVSQLLIF